MWGNKWQWQTLIPPWRFFKHWFISHVLRLWDSLSTCLLRDERTYSHFYLGAGRPYRETQGQWWRELLTGVWGKPIRSSKHHPLTLHYCFSDQFRSEDWADFLFGRYLRIVLIIFVALLRAVLQNSEGRAETWRKDSPSSPTSELCQLHSTVIFLSACLCHSNVLIFENTIKLAVLLLCGE